jgi:chemotaxis protein MotB
VKQEREQLAANLADARRRLEAEEAEKAGLEQERAAKEAEIQRLTKTHDDLAKSLQDEIAKGDIQLKQVRDRLTINMVDRVLFDSGQAQVKPAGLKVLKQVSDVLRKVADKQIRIEGHTDNVPIGVKLREKFATNWELSTARATSVVRYLIEEGGIDRAMISAGGYADTRPVDSNDTEGGKAANRRIEIVLYPKDLAEIVRSDR